MAGHVKDKLALVVSKRYLLLLRGRIGFDWSVVVPAASRGLGWSSSLKSRSKNKEQLFFGSRRLNKGGDVAAPTSTRGRQRHQWGGAAGE
jgi:hypothetical protein